MHIFCSDAELIFVSPPPFRPPMCKVSRGRHPDIDFTIIKDVNNTRLFWQMDRSWINSTAFQLMSRLVVLLFDWRMALSPLQPTKTKHKSQLFSSAIDALTI